MRTFLILLLGIMPLAAQNNGIDQPSDFVTPPSGGKFLRWYGKQERTYFVQVSSDAEPLQKWSWAPIIETGNNQTISHEVFGSAPRGFFRLKYTDDPIPAEKTPDTADFDSDELENYAEITGTPQTDPLNADTDSDGMPDGWEKAHGLNGNDSADAAYLFPGTNLTNLQAYNAGVQANANATPTNKDGDDLDDIKDADPNDKYVDWEPAVEAPYAVIELEKEAYGEPLPTSIDTECHRSASIGNGGLVLYDVLTSHTEFDGEYLVSTDTRTCRVWKDGAWSIQLVDQITPRTDYLGNKHNISFPTVCGDYVIGEVDYHNDSSTYDPKTSATRWNLESENPSSTRIYDQEDVGGENTNYVEGFNSPVTSPGGAVALASGSNNHPEIAKWRIWLPPTDSTSSSYIPGSGPSTAQMPYFAQSPDIPNSVLAIEDQGAMVVWTNVEKMNILDGGTKCSMPRKGDYHCMSRVPKGNNGDSRIVVGATDPVYGPNGNDYENGNSCLWIKKGSKVNSAQRTPTIGWIKGIANNGVILGKHAIWRNGKAVSLDSLVANKKVDGPTSATRYTNLEGLAINGNGAIVATADDQLNQGEGHKTLILLAPVEVMFVEPDDETWRQIMPEKRVVLDDKNLKFKLVVNGLKESRQEKLVEIGLHHLHLTTTGTRPLLHTRMNLFGPSTDISVTSESTEIRVKLNRASLRLLDLIPQSEADEIDKERSTLDHASEDESNFTDSATFIDVAASVYRGYSKNDDGLSLTNELFKSELDRTFIQAAGSEKLTVKVEGMAIEGRAMVMNQADVFYYSGHGLSDVGDHVANQGDYHPGLVALDESDGSGIVHPSDLSSYWSRDLNVAVIAGCAVLNINNWVPFPAYFPPTVGPGVGYWPGKVMENIGPPFLVGYAALAPSDNQGSAAIAAAFISAYESSCDAFISWRDANDNSNGRNACAIQRGSKYGYFLRSTFLGIPSYSWTEKAKIGDWNP